MNKIERNTKRSKKIPVIAVIIFAVVTVVGFYFYKQSQEKIRFPVGNSDWIIMTTLPVDDTFNNTFNKMMREVNTYRTSGKFSRDSMETRGETIYEILAQYEGNIIEEGSLEIRGSSVTGDLIPYGGDFEIGFRDAEYYYEFYRTHN